MRAMQLASLVMEEQPFPPPLKDRYGMFGPMEELSRVELDNELWEKYEL